jgi:tetratricopeptide (TPR) repeat protein
MVGLRHNVACLQGDLVRERFGLTGLPSVLSRTWLVWCLAELGEFPEAIAQGEDALRIAEGLGERYSGSVAYRALGLPHLYRGDLASAVSAFERGLALCPEEYRRWFSVIAGHLGYAYVLSGRLTGGLQLLEQAAVHLPVVSVHHSRLTAYLAEGYLRADRIDDAVEFGRRALELSRQRGERGHEAYALRLIGEIAWRRDADDLPAAEEPYQRALALAEELGMLPLAAHCHLGLGALYRGGDRRTQAEEHLAVAAAAFRDMDMRFWLERAEAERASLG